MANATTYLDVVDDVDGHKTLKERASRYKLDRQGLFVLIITERFGYTDPFLGDKGYYDHLNYEKEIGMWEQLIPRKHRSGMMIGHNLMPAPKGSKSEHGHYYESFLENIKKEIKQQKFSFVVVYVASHGDADGNFMLASHLNKDVNGKLEVDERMCSGTCNPQTECQCQDECRCKDECHCDEEIFKPQHKYKKVGEKEKSGFKKCHKRNLDGLVNEIQNIEDKSGCKVLSGIPKIFIAQMCRGEKRDAGEGKFLSSNDGGKETVVYTVPDADTLRFYSTLAGHPSRVYPDGCSILLDKLYKVLRAFHADIPKNDSKVITNISKNEMKRLKKRIGKSFFSRETKLSTDRWVVEVEDVVHGWITDVFTQVCHEMGLKLGIVDRDKVTGKIARRVDKQVPEYHSSLTRKLSALEMFRQEYPN